MEPRALSTCSLVLVLVPGVESKPSGAAELVAGVSVDLETLATWKITVIMFSSHAFN